MSSGLGPAAAAKEEEAATHGVEINAASGHAQGRR